MAKKSYSRIILPLSLIALSLCCLLIVAGVIGTIFLWPDEVTTKPVVLIKSPTHGTEVGMGRPVPIHAIATDEKKVKRVELWIDGELLESQESTLADGVSPFPFVVYWQPRSSGPHTLTIRAFNAQGRRAHSSIDIEAVTAVALSGDTDGDTVGDSVDECPDTPGSHLAFGCPDADQDGLGDGDDACPDIPGLPAFDGCPLPEDTDSDGIPDNLDECPDASGTLATEGCPDADGDTIPDFVDECQTEPGAPGAPGGDGCPAPGDLDQDGDGTEDEGDLCPTEGGSPTTHGCPDADGDGVQDGEDACPDEPGLPGDDGCPTIGGGEDSDGDGVRDADDECFDEPGEADHAGRPDQEDEAGGDGAGASDDPADIQDLDGDGLPDPSDLCPEEAGLPEHEGCPAPGEEADEDGDGIPDDESGPEDDSPLTFPDMDLSTVMVAVEFQALEFEVSHDYDGLYCYPRMTGVGVERYSIEPSERQWNIGEDLGSRILALLPTEELHISMECGGDNVYLGPEESWGVYYDLGNASRSHPASDWDGHVITVRSTGGDEGRWFEAKYRICEGTCDNSVFHPPIIAITHMGGPSQLLIIWGGDRDEIDGFRVYADNNPVFRIPAEATSQSIAGYEPQCGSGRREFSVTAYQGNRESPPSNLAFWSRQPCPRVVRVTFEQIETFDLQDERRMDGQLGPVSGEFWVQGSEQETLIFDGNDHPDGFKFSPYSVYGIQAMFDQIWVWIINGGTGSYLAPDHNTVTVELGPYDDLSFGGLIHDQDRQVYQRVFFGTKSIPADELTPGLYTVRDGQFELTVSIDVLVGPEVGPQPDLTITDVTEFGGQLRIHVFNNAAPLENRDVDVALVRISTNEIIETRTWRNVTLGSGAEVFFQSSDLVMEPYDLRVIVDPDNKIDEMNEGNNIFETPVVMRLEFTGLRVPDWPCEGWQHTNGEVWFHLSVGYGPTEDETYWVGHRVRHPETGIIQWNRHDYPPPIWSLEEQPRYTFDFEMPANENLYVYLKGYEQDGNSNQSMGKIEVTYSPDDNYGANTEEHRASSTGLATTECSAWEPVGANYYGFDAWWRITRVH